MQPLSVRTKIGAAIISALVLIPFGLNSWLHSRAATAGDGKPASVAPIGPDGKPAAVELPAGGTADAASPDTGTAPATPAPGAPNPAVPSSPTTPSAPTAAGDVLYVHVAGAVHKPGVYKFKVGDRINDAVVAAGGFVNAADKDALNLADRLQDADQIYIPTREESSPAASAAARTTGSAISNATAAAPRRRHALITHGGSAMAATAAMRPADSSGSVAPSAATIRAGVSNAPTQVATGASHGRVLGRQDAAPADAPSADPAPGATDDSPADDIAPAASTRRSSGSVSKSGRGASSSHSGKSAKFKNPGDGIVHLNSAGAAQLEQLPGVGPAMSSRILDYRAQIGKFTDPAQLMDVKGIGDKKYAKMQPFLAL